MTETITTRNERAERYLRHVERCRRRRRVLTLQWFALLLFSTLALYFLTLVEVF